MCFLLQPILAELCYRSKLNSGENFLTQVISQFLLSPSPYSSIIWIILLSQYTRGVLLTEHAPGLFCTCQYTRGSVFKFAQFALGACSQIFNLLNIVEHFCSRGWSIPMKSLVHTEELCSRSMRLEHAPGAKSLVCIGLKAGFNCTLSPHQQCR